MSNLVNVLKKDALGLSKKTLMLALGFGLVASLGHVGLAHAQDAAAAAAPTPTVNKGDTAWMLVSTCFVLLMILPGLAIFYGGLVRAKNMLSMIMQVSVTAAIGMIAWALWGYSLAFTDGGGLNSFVGGTSKFFLNGVTPASQVETFSPMVNLPEFVFFAFQMTFAAITATLVLGSVAERMKFGAVVVFAILWPLLSYYPMAHMVWWWSGATSAIPLGADVTKSAGLLWAWGAIDFAGGTVVHINAGIAALVGCLILGPRQNYRNEPMAPHSLTMTMIGAGLLWVGWFGFNAGSNLESNGYAGLAMVNTFLATAAAGLSWALTEYFISKRPSGLGFASGLVAGLVAVTPAAGFAGPVGAIVLGLIVSPICIIFCAKVKHIFKYDDSLDAFGIHGVGGIVGAIATGVLAHPSLGGAGIVDFSKCTAEACAAYEFTAIGQMIVQIKAVAVAIVWSAVASTIVFGLIKYTMGLRASPDAEEDGLDIAEHGERAYHM